MIKIIEKSVIGKRNEAECEDGIIVNDNFVAVELVCDPERKIFESHNSPFM